MRLRDGRAWGQRDGARLVGFRHAAQQAAGVTPLFRNSAKNRGEFVENDRIG